jgi:hypothetical protein
MIPSHRERASVGMATISSLLPNIEDDLQPRGKILGIPMPDLAYIIARAAGYAVGNVAGRTNVQVH